MTIISILASMLLPTVARAYRKAKGVAEELEAPEIELLLLESSRKYCSANPQFCFTNKSDFAEKCALAPKCRDWMYMRYTEFVPFNYSDPTNKLVLSVRLGRRYATLYTFTKGRLSIEPQR